MECARCGAPGADRKCGRCKAAYCGPACQRADWKAGHKAACTPPVCYICMDDDDPEPVHELGCACTRGNAGHAHVGCAIRAASESADPTNKASPWIECPVCKHQYNGVMRASLVEAYRAENPTDLTSAKAMIMSMLQTSREREAIAMARQYRAMCAAAGDNNVADIFETLEIEAIMMGKGREAYAEAGRRLGQILERTLARGDTFCYHANRLKLMIAQTQLFLGTADLDTIHSIESTLGHLSETDELHWGVTMLAATTRLLYGSRDVGLEQLDRVVKGSRRIFGPDHPMHKAAVFNMEVARNGRACHEMARKGVFPFTMRI